MQISNHGQIANMQLPANWLEAEAAEHIDIGTRSVRAFYPSGHEDVQLKIFYRGLPISEETARTFRKILDQAPHTLTEKEIESLSELLVERARPTTFTIVKCNTDVLNGKPVLILIGTYKENENQLYEIFVDASGDGRLIQEIYLIGPTDSYRQFLKEVRPCLQGIEWTPSISSVFDELENSLPEMESTQ
jgi:hypothetical protein